MSRRPLPVTILLGMVLCLTAWNAIRLGTSLLSWPILAEVAKRPGPLYLAITGALWTIGGWLLWQRIRRRDQQARRWMAVYLFGYLAWYWLDRMWFRSAFPNWPFLATFTFVIAIGIVYNLLHPTTARYFCRRENYEQSDSNPRTS